MNKNLFIIVLLVLFISCKDNPTEAVVDPYKDFNKIKFSFKESCHDFIDETSKIEIDGFILNLGFDGFVSIFDSYSGYNSNHDFISFYKIRKEFYNQNFSDSLEKLFSIYHFSSFPYKLPKTDSTTVYYSTCFKLISYRQNLIDSLKNIFDRLIPQNGFYEYPESYTQFRKSLVILINNL